MEIPIIPSENISTLKQEFPFIYDFDPLKVQEFLEVKLNEVLQHQNRSHILSTLINTINTNFLSTISQYKDLLKSPDQTLSKNAESIKKSEDTLATLLKLIKTLTICGELGQCSPIFTSCVELIYISLDFKIVKYAIDILAKLIFIDRRFLQMVQDGLSRTIHQISMLALHRNLYNSNSITLPELLSDDSLFKDLLTTLGNKINPQKYDDSLYFEYFLNSPSITSNSTSTESDSDNIVINIPSISQLYPNDSHLVIVDKIIKEKSLSVETDSPIYDALLFRVRLALDFKNYKTRQAIISTVLSSLSFLGKVRLHMANRYELFIFQHHDLTPFMNEALHLFHLNASPSLHKDVYKMLISFAKKIFGGVYQEFFHSKLAHSETLAILFKDLLCLELKNSDPSTVDPAKITINVRPLILPRESILTPKLLAFAVKLFNKVVHEFYYDEHRRGILPEIDALSHLVGTLLAMITPASLKNFFFYDKKVINQGLALLKYLMFHRDFAREHNIMDQLIDYTENLFQLLNSDQKLYMISGESTSTWALMEKKTHIESINTFLEMISHFFVMTTRHTRADNAPTVARKVVESGLLKDAHNYF